jgi:NtrC-family two-component system response regulator AlgB
VSSSSSSLEEIEREQIMRVLAESPTLQDAADALGINATTLWRKRRRYKLD